MAIHIRRAPFLAAIGALVLGGASVVRAQDTSAAARPDTSGYQGYQKDTAQAGQQAGGADSSGFKYNGPPTDTTLKAKPGAQTGPTAGDSGGAAGMAGMTADTVVCKDGSNAANGEGACGSHGGVDSVATEAAMKARGQTGGMDSSSMKDTSSMKDSSSMKDTSSTKPPQSP